MKNLLHLIQTPEQFFIMLLLIGLILGSKKNTFINKIDLNVTSHNLILKTSLIIGNAFRNLVIQKLLMLLDC